MFLLECSCFVAYYGKDPLKTKQRRVCKNRRNWDFQNLVFFMRSNETQLSKDEKMVFFEISWTVVYATVEIL